MGPSLGKAQLTPRHLIASNSVIPSAFEPGGSGVLSGVLSTLSRPGESLLPSKAGDLPLQPKHLYIIPKGPWGELEYYVTYLQIPAHYADLIPMPLDRTMWHFSESDENVVIGLMAEAGITLVSGKEWHDLGIFHHVPDQSGISFQPTEELIAGLSSDQRSGVHQILGGSEINRYYYDPIVIESGDPLRWYLDAGLDEALAQSISELCYKKGKAMIFSDVPYVLSKIPTLEGRRQFLRATTRTRSLMLRLNIGNTEGADEIADYWTNGYKRKAVLPILDSIIDTPGVERLDVAHLLPPTPRKLLFTYPSLGENLISGDKDCHWTSLNFFRANPYDQLPASIMAEVLGEQYEAVKGDLQFGDVILMQDPDTKGFKHSAVYIAGSIVFTKNGYSRMSPWVYMRYDDMEARYSVRKTLNPIAVRRKSIHD